MGPYIADFFCPSAALVIEVDGATHVDRGADVRRDAGMQSQGLRVLRVWNDEVIGNIEGVLQAIAIAATPPPGPLPQGEGEK
jgi:very-short-patch-repair endonuclease